MNVVLVAVMGGCLGSGSDKNATSSGAAAPSGNNATASNGTKNSSAPMASVKILDNGTEVAAANGSYPLGAGVNVTFDGSGSSDPDGGNVTYAWAFGDNGTATNATVVHAYLAAGNYTLRLTVTDDENQTASKSLNITVAPSGPAPGTLLEINKLHKTGTYTVATQSGLSCVGSTTGSGSSAANVWTIPAVSTGGVASKVSKFDIKLTGSTTTFDQAFRFAGPDGKVIKDQDATSAPDPATETYTVEGSFAPGAYTITVYGCLAVDGSWTLDAQAWLVAA